MYRLSHRVLLAIVAAAVVLNASGASQSPAQDNNADRIKPYDKNPRYWQYKGQPVMLLGGSKTDHIFLLDDLKTHLDEMRAVGANYVRNTMSQREGEDLKPYKLLPDGKFDLDQWNQEYWKRFRNMLEWTAEREIIVQIEVWDRFDYTDARELNYWQISPWRPANNVNYTAEQTGLADRYTRHPSHDQHPFFHTVPGMPRYDKKLDLIRMYQEAFVAKMLSYSLDYGHVLYCMDNETSTPAQWGKYWIRFIKAKAAEKDVTVCTTDMFDDAFRAEEAKHTPIIFNDAEHYMFADISQVNSRNYDEMHWDRLQWLLRQVNMHPRPSNHTKIYGSGYKSFGTGGPEDGVERFWRNILGGSASARFHRPDSGNGLNDFAKGSIKAARILESLIKFWDITPQMDLLSNRESNEAYLAAKPGEYYALYFTNGGSVGLDLSGATGSFDVTWINPSFTLHEIVPGPCTIHWPAYADIDADGDIDILAGHCNYRHGDPGENDPPDVFWLELVRSGGSVRWVKHQLANDFNLGFGCAVGDVDNDGDLDLVAPGIANKRGKPSQLDVLLFTNESK